MLPLESVSHWIFSQSKIHPSLCGYEAVSGALSGGIRWCLFLCYFVNYLIFISMMTSVCLNIIQHPAVSIAVSPGFFFQGHFHDTPSYGGFFFHTGSWGPLLPFHASFPDPPDGLRDLFGFDNHASVFPPFLKMAGLRVTSSRQTW